MASSTGKRILVHVRRSNSHFSAATFKQCIFDQLGIQNMEKLWGKVACHLEDNKLFLEPASSPTDNDNKFSGGFILKHPPFCPVLTMSEEDGNSLPEDILNRGVDVGVAVILETSDECILVTRRSLNMNTFPGVWVPPGGHIEVNETLEETGLRELHEETGLTIPLGSKTSSDILALWESVFPPVLFQGLPKRHHIVVYLHICLNKTSLEMKECMKLNPEEVDAALWLPLNLGQSVVLGVPPSSEKQKLEYLAVDKNGEQSYREMDPSVLREKMPSPGADIERISTGTRYAIEMWYRKKTLHVTSFTCSSNL